MTFSFTWPFILVQLLNCVQLWNPMERSMPGFPVYHPLLEFAQTRPLSCWCLPTISSSGIPLFSCLQSFLTSSSFPMSHFFASGGQSIRASASVLPMNIQDSFPLGLTGLILQSKGHSRVFSSTAIQKCQFLGIQPSLWPNSHIHTWLLEKL